MDDTLIHLWTQQNPRLALVLVIVISIVVFLAVRILLGRGLTALARHTETKIDDVLNEKLKPSRIAWLAPLLVIYLLAELEPTYQVWIEKAALLPVLWITVLTINALMNAINVFYESSSSYKGVWSSPTFVDSHHIPIASFSNSQGLTCPRWL